MKKNAKRLLLAALVVAATLYAARGPVYSDAKAPAQSALKIVVVDVNKAMEGSREFVAERKKLSDQKAELVKTVNGLSEEIEKARTMLKNVRKRSDAWWSWTDKLDLLLVRQKILADQSKRKLAAGRDRISIRFAASLNTAVAEYCRANKVDLVLRRDPKAKSIQALSMWPVLYASTRADVTDAILAILNKQANDGD